MKKIKRVQKELEASQNRAHRSNLLEVDSTIKGVTQTIGDSKEIDKSNKSNKEEKSNKKGMLMLKVNVI